MCGVCRDGLLLKFLWQKQRMQMKWTSVTVACFTSTIILSTAVLH